jgi:hypothetical protein
MTTETKTQAELVSVLADINNKVSLESFYSIETGHGRIKLQGHYSKQVRKQCETAFDTSFYLTDENWVKLQHDELNLSIYLTLPE